MKTLNIFMYACFCASLLLFSCQGNTDSASTAAATEDSSNTQEASADKTEYSPDMPIIEGLYATNTRNPQRSNSVFNLFDGNTATIWQTSLGSGVDEGIMIYFSRELEVGAVEVAYPSGQEHAAVSQLWVYAGGICFKDPAKINAKTQSLYLRFADTDEMQIFKGDNGKEQRQFPLNKNFSASEISIYDAQHNKIDFLLAQRVKGRITATSTLAPATAYTPSNLNDCKKEYAWAEGAKGLPVGEQITFSFDKEVSLSEIKLWNGYHRSEAHYQENARIKSFSFGPKGGQAQSYELDDLGLSPESITLAEGCKGREFVLTLDDYYPGTKYSDAVLSEIRFFDGILPLIIETDTEEKQIAQLQSSANPQLLAILDKIIATHCNTEKIIEDRPATDRSKSIIIRSNNTFVYYNDYKLIESDNQVYGQKGAIADGGWELVSQGEGFARIRIFGQKYSTGVNERPYAENESEQVKIFQDFITITDKTVQGDKFIEKIDLLWE